MSAISNLARRAGIAAVSNAVEPAPVRPALVHPTDLDDEAREAELGMQTTSDPRQRAAEAHQLYAQPASLPLPPYVQHAENATRTGILSAQAVVMEYERAAKEIEELGAYLAKMQDETQASVDVLTKAFSDLTATAVAYREEAKRVFERIQQCAITANDVTALCGGLREKIAQS